MKQFPSIYRNPNAGEMYVFDKLDGSNLRFEGTRRKGKTWEWVKYGTRTRLFDETDPVFGKAIAIFHSSIAHSLAEMALEERWESATFFCEFHGPNSFAGWHDPTDKHRVTLIDISPHKKGILGPKEFIRLVDKFKVPDTATFLGRFKWNQEFIQAIYEGKVPGVTFEGVVGKNGESHKLQMWKTKSKAWIDKVKEKYSVEEAAKLLES